MKYIFYWLSSIFIWNFETEWRKICCYCRVFAFVFKENKVIGYPCMSDDWLLERQDCVSVIFVSTECSAGRLSPNLLLSKQVKECLIQKKCMLPLTASFLLHPWAAAELKEQPSESALRPVSWRIPEAQVCSCSITFIIFEWEVSLLLVILVNSGLGRSFSMNWHQHGLGFTACFYSPLSDEGVLIHFIHLFR